MASALLANASWGPLKFQNPSLAASLSKSSTKRGKGGRKKASRQNGLKKEENFGMLRSQTWAVTLARGSGQNPGETQKEDLSSA